LGQPPCTVEILIPPTIKFPFLILTQRQPQHIAPDLAAAIVEDAFGRIKASEQYVPLIIDNFFVPMNFFDAAAFQS
jgi:hypothetical protein